MKNKKYSIVYSSLTGNTKVLADANDLEKLKEAVMNPSF